MEPEPKIKSFGSATLVEPVICPEYQFLNEVSVVANPDPRIHIILSDPDPEKFKNIFAFFVS